MSVVNWVITNLWILLLWRPEFRNDIHPDIRSMPSKCWSLTCRTENITTVYSFNKIEWRKHTPVALSLTELASCGRLNPLTCHHWIKFYGDYSEREGVSLDTNHRCWLERCNYSQLRKTPLKLWCVTCYCVKENVRGKRQDTLTTWFKSQYLKVVEVIHINKIFCVTCVDIQYDFLF